MSGGTTSGRVERELELDERRTELVEHLAEPSTAVETPTSPFAPSFPESRSPRRFLRKK